MFVILKSVFIHIIFLVLRGTTKTTAKVLFTKLFHQILYNIKIEIEKSNEVLYLDWLHLNYSSALLPNSEQ